MYHFSIGSFKNFVFKTHWNDVYSNRREFNSHFVTFFSLTSPYSLWGWLICLPNSIKGVFRMQAYEFFAKPENGTIKIPERYKNRITSDIKVILLDEKPITFNREEINARRKSDLLLSPTMNTKGWRFNREEANER